MFGYLPYALESGTPTWTVIVSWLGVVCRMSYPLFKQFLFLNNKLEYVADTCKLHSSQIS